jgi:hypothetical protein
MAITGWRFRGERMSPSRSDLVHAPKCMARGPCLIAHLPRSARLETQLKPFLCPDETIVTHGRRLMGSGATHAERFHNG